MATILTKRSNTASSVPVAGDLTNSTGGAELAVNTADKRLFTKDSGGTVVELGTNPSSITLASGTANAVPYLNGSKVLTSGSALTFDGSQLSVTRGSLGTSALFYTNDGTYNPRLAVYGTADGTVLQHTWSSGAASMIFALGGAVGSGSEQMRLTSTGLGIGTSSPAWKLDVDGIIASRSGSLSGLRFQTSANGNNGYVLYETSSNSLIVNNYNAGPITFKTSDTERARIDSSGNLLVGDTSTLGSARGYINAPSGSNGWTTKVQNNSNVLFNGYNSSGTQIFYVKGDGGIANYSANNTNLSDERTKTDIQEAGGYLSKICAIPVKTFKYKNQEDDELNLGVIAQDVEAVAPELVDVSGFGETPEDGIPLKAIYQTDLQYALMKCIQEQQAIIEQLKARLDAANL